MMKIPQSPFGLQYQATIQKPLIRPAGTFSPCLGRREKLGCYLKAKVIQYVFFILSPLLLASCATMNSEFSCKGTATDSCLTIEQVDAMTRFADDEKPKNYTVYIPAHRDTSGRLIPAHTVRNMK